MNRNDLQSFDRLMADAWGLKDKRKPVNSVLKLWAKFLQPYSFDQVRRAFSAYFADPDAGRFLPMPADIIDRIESAAGDGFPGADEAWATCPKTEFDSVVWCDQIASAWSVAEPLMRDEVAARMAFRDAYKREIAKAKANGDKPRWFASLGHDPAGRERVIQQAVQLGRITGDHAAGLLPAPEGGLLMIEGQAGDDEKRKEAIANLRRILGAKPSVDIEQTEVQRSIINQRGKL